MASHVVTTRFIYPRMIARMTQEAKVAAKPAAVTATAEASTQTATNISDRILPSLGASGAIYAAVSLTALAFPQTEISLMIPPSFPIPIQWGVGSLVAVDIIGALRGWRFVCCLLVSSEPLNAFTTQAFRPLGPSRWSCVRSVVLQLWTSAMGHIPRRTPSGIHSTKGTKGAAG